MISAVLTNYNHSRFLPRVLDMILNQTVPFDEFIILDDCSTDDSVAIIEAAIRNVPYARLIRNGKNMGIEATLNRGIDEAKGEFIFFVAADDQYSKRIMELAREAITRWPDVGMISGNSKTNNEATGEKRTFILPFPQEMAVYGKADLENIAQGRCLTFFGGANVFRKEALRSVGGYLPELKWHSDWLLYILIPLRYRVAIVPEIMVDIRLSPNQYSFSCFEWAKQAPVIETFIHVLKNKYPNEYPFFRNHGLLPTYDLEALWLLLRKPGLRSYLTPLLIWRLLTYKPARWVARTFIKPQYRDFIRKRLRL